MTNTSHFSITQASAIAGATTFVTMVVAMVPSWAPLKEALIAAAGSGISLAFLIANSIHAHAAAQPSLPVPPAVPAPVPSK